MGLASASVIRGSIVSCFSIANNIVRSKPFYRTIMSSSSLNQKDVAGTAVTIREPSQAFSPPEMYRTQPPPHHTSADPSKRSFKSPWPSAGSGSMSLLGFLRIRLFEWEGVPMPAAKDRPQAKPCAWKVEGAATQDDDKIRFTWIGHAGCHFRIPSGDAGAYVTVLTDPVLSYRCSPSQLLGPARLQEAPTTIAEMAASDVEGVWPDVLVLSHNHYDHLDYDTIKALISRPNGRPVPHVFCTLGVASFFYGLGLPKESVTELDWWQQREIGWQDDNRRLKLTCVPAQHFSGRGLHDRNRSLWAGWTIEAPARSPEKAGKKVYFAGDSGYRAISRAFLASGEPDSSLPYCPAFEEIGSLLGPFDLAAIPIGAYKPRIAMSPVHMNPVEAVDVHKQVQAKRSVGIHWASFALAAEPVYEPKELLAQELEKRKLDADEFITMEIGETREF